MSIRFRKKPVEIDAIRWTGGSARAFDDVFEFTDGQFRIPQPGSTYESDGVTALVWDKLHSTWVGVKTGQWVIRGTEGEFYPCADDGTGGAPINYERVEAE